MKISACWIVKNEAQNIASSIISVRDCAEELIVVDTGSTDDTVRIAKECGARVEYFNWTDDFSAARNYTLSLAKGEYVIFIDGDEHFSPGLNQKDREVILKSFQEAKVDVLLIPRIEADLATGGASNAEPGGASNAMPHGRIMRRAAVHYEYRIHEMLKIAAGAIPNGIILEEYCLLHEGSSPEQLKRKTRRNIAILEAERPQLEDEFSLFNNSSYLMREYLALGNHEKSFEACRYLLDHSEQWRIACKTFLFGYIQRFYAAISLAAENRFWFSRKELYDKLFQEIKANYPASREAVFADLYYRVIFDYREESFLRDLALAEKEAENKPPCVTWESRQAEAMIYGRAAFAAYCRKDREKARRYAAAALQNAPEQNQDVMRSIMVETSFANPYPGICVALRNDDYPNAYEQIVRELTGNPLNHNLLEFLSIIAENAGASIAENAGVSLAAEARERYETGMALLDESIELADVINTGYVRGPEAESQVHGLAGMDYAYFAAAFQKEKDRPILREVIELYQMAAPVYEQKNRPVSALRCYLILTAQGRDAEQNRLRMARLLREHGNNGLAERILQEEKENPKKEKENQTKEKENQTKEKENQTKEKENKAIRRYKICVYALCKNEAQFAERWFTSMKEADRVVVLDTGSADQTPEILRACGAEVYTETIEPWRWDVARARALAYVPDDVDICVATDLDDVWAPGWRGRLEDAWAQGATRIMHLYNYGILPDGRPVNQNASHSRIHARHGYQWTRANHEFLKYTGTEQEKIVYAEGLTLNHYPDLSKSRSFNLELTRLALQEDPDDVEMIYRLGADYFNARQFDAAVKVLRQGLEHPRKVRSELRWSAMRTIAKCFDRMGNPDEAYRWFFRAIAEDNRFRDGYVELAMLAYARKDWNTALFGACKALEITGAVSGAGDAVSWGYIPDHIASVAYYELGFWPKALEYARRALKLAPDDEQLQRNIRNLESMI